MSEVAVMNLGVKRSAVYLGIALVWWILQIIANWKVFTKANEGGWKSIVPVVSGHTAFKIAWNPIWFWVSMVVTGVGAYIQNYSGENVEKLGGTLLVVALVAMVVGLAIQIIYCFKLAKAFGKGIGFTIGLIFLHPFFILSLGLGDAKYKRS